MRETLRDTTGEGALRGTSDVGALRGTASEGALRGTSNVGALRGAATVGTLRGSRSSVDEAAECSIVGKGARRESAPGQKLRLINAVIRLSR